MDSNEKKWVTIKKKLEQEILQGNKKATEQFYTVMQVKDMYNVSVNTAHKALCSMEEEGIIHNRQNRGFYVLPYANVKLKNKYINEFAKQLNDETVLMLKNGLQVSEIMEILQNLLNALNSDNGKESSLP